MFSANENIALRKYKRRVVDYVEATIPSDVLNLGVSVMAMQVNCKAPGCVPVETALVIVFPAADRELLPGLPESAGGSYRTKVLRPMSAVERDDVLDALPPAFAGGRRSAERLYLQARDVMLGQITQLFGNGGAGDDVAGRKLVAEYLQSSLQEYIDNNCEPPEWGQAFPATASKKQQEEVATSAPENATTTTSTTDAMRASYASYFGGTGNIVIRRPVDEGTTATSETTTTAGAAVVRDAPSSNVSQSSSIITSITTNKPEVLLAGWSVNSISSSRNSRMLLSQLSSREHAPGVRRAGCPCCDPDNPSNVVDRLLSQL